LKSVRGSTRVALVLLCLLVSLPTASAHNQTILDDDDTSGPLDIAAAKYGHECVEYLVNGHARCTKYHLTFKVVAYEEWENTDLFGEFKFIVIEFVRRKRGGATDEMCYYVEPDPDGGLRGQMYDICWPSPAQPVKRERPVRRVDGHSIRGIIPKGFLGKKLARYRVRAVSSWEEEGDADCDPGPTPPEKVYGTCTDETDWSRGHLRHREQE